MKKNPIVEFLLWKSFHLFVGLVMITSVIFLERQAFCIHVAGVTFLLLIVLYKINSAYGPLVNKFLIYEQIVILGGVMHIFVPLIGMFFPIAMFVHVGICFVVHILHLLQCYQVFNDINMKDTQYILILWLVNIEEFSANLVYCFPNAIHGYWFAVMLVPVEVCALLISSLKLKSHPKGIVPASAAVVDSSDSQASSSYTPQFFSWDTFDAVLEFLATRICVLFISQITCVLMLAFKAYDYPIFLCGFGVLLVIVTIRLHCIVSAAQETTTLAAIVLLPSIAVVIAWLTHEDLIPSLAGVLISFGLFLLVSGCLLFGMKTNAGYDHAFHVAVIMVALFVGANISYIVEPEGHLTQCFMCASMAAAMLVSLTNVAKKKHRVVSGQHSRESSSNAVNGNSSNTTSNVATSLKPGEVRRNSKSAETDLIRPKMAFEEQFEGGDVEMFNREVFQVEPFAV